MRITKLLLGVGGSKAIVRQVVDHLLWAVQSENFRLDVLRESNATSDDLTDGVDLLQANVQPEVRIVGDGS